MSVTGNGEVQEDVSSGRRSQALASADELGSEPLSEELEGERTEASKELAR